MPSDVKWRISAGLCIKCGGTPPVQGKRHCLACREIMRAYARKHMNKVRDEPRRKKRQKKENEFYRRYSMVLENNKNVGQCFYCKKFTRVTGKKQHLETEEEMCGGYQICLSCLINERKNPNGERAMKAVLTLIKNLSKGVTP